MILSNVKSEYFNRGVFTFENGKYIWIEEIQYSYDGSYWESTFLPEKHIDPGDPTASIEGHKYRRVRHAGDNFFQNPAYIVAEDGKPSEKYISFLKTIETSFTPKHKRKKPGLLI